MSPATLWCRRATLAGAGVILLGLGLAAGAHKEETSNKSAAPPTPEAHVQAIYQNPAYTFCHRRGYPLTAEEVAWCPLWTRDQKAACRALAPACARGPSADLLGRTGRFELALPEVPPGLEILFVLVLAGGLVALLAFLLRALRAGRALRPRVREETLVEPGASDARAAARLVETDVDRLLARAQAAAAAGEFSAAVADTHAALLRRLGGAHLVDVDPQFTKGEYLAQMAARRPPLEPEVEPILTDVERLQFSKQPTTRNDFETIWRRVLDLIATRLGPLAMLVLVALTGACRLDREGWEVSPSGRQAVLDLVARSGGTLRERLSDLRKLDGDVDGVVLLPGAKLDPDTWHHLLAWVRAGGALLVAGRVPGAPVWFAHVDQPTSTSTPAPSPGNDPISVEPSKAQLWPQTHGEVPPGPSVDLTKAPPGWTPLLARPSGTYAIEGAHGDGDIVVLADDYLFQNAALLVPGNAGLTLGLVFRLGKQVELVGDLTGLVAKHAVDTVERGRLLPAILQLFLLCALFFAWKGAHFGRPRAPAPTPRRAFVEHTVALAQHYRRAHGGRHILRAYSVWALERLRQRLRRSGDGRLSVLAEAIAARTDIPLSEVVRTLVKAQVPPDMGEIVTATDSAAALATMDQLATLLAQTGGPVERDNLQRPV